MLFDKHLKVSNLGSIACLEPLRIMYDDSGMLIRFETFVDIVLASFVVADSVL